ncbi:halocyanin domain-containing protein (plasmid) [Haladaptatus sp. SPP-AMP-3]|uniref:halocyanin domain-containing protein n=1 Tax=Haladaptatus sp. SPP-AMP-3 TaxID=3121295 RepID=UPI003C2E36E4
MTGKDAVTITVGADGNGGPYAFKPPAVRITPGTIVTFKWVSNAHNVLPTDQPEEVNWKGEPKTKTSGYSFNSTFDSAGTYKYVCEPHRSMGMKGAIVVSNDQDQQNTASK